MHEWTERPGFLLSEDAKQIIQHRYDRARKLAEGKSVLEVGSGAGLGLEYLRGTSSSMLGLEYSRENINFCLKHYNSTLPVIQGNAHHMPFSDGSFDMIIAMAMIYYLSLDVFLKEAGRILKNNGVLFFCTSNKDVPGFVRAPHTTDYFSIPELNRILANHGFKCEFEGAFPAAISNHFLMKMRAIVKNTAKYIINIFPSGQEYWNKMRLNAQGPTSPMPSSLGNIECSSVETEKLPSTKKNRRFRVIYCTAYKL
jgi:SAM-dependent methyltransferase